MRLLFLQNLDYEFLGPMYISSMLKALIKRLIRLRPNRLFTWWFGLVYFLLYVMSEHRNVWSTLKFALRNFRHVLVKQ